MRFLLALLFAAIPAAASAQDLAKIDRTIAKLPKLQSNDPQFCLIFFGKDPKTRKVMWAVLDGKKLYLDLNGNRDLTEPGEAFESDFFWNASFKQPGDDFLYTLKLRPSSIHLTLPDGLEQAVLFGGGAGKFEYGSDPASAPVVHLNGPWSMHPGWGTTRLSTRFGSMFTVALGTPGFGSKSMAIIPSKKFLADGRHIAAEIDYPHRDPQKGTVRAELKLTQTSGVFAGQVLQPPPSVGPGTARVRLRFVGWDEKSIPPATFDLPVVDD